MRKELTRKQIEKLKKVVKEMKNRTAEALTDEEIRELEKETEGAVRLSEEVRLSEIMKEYEDLLKDIHTALSVILTEIEEVLD